MKLIAARPFRPLGHSVVALLVLAIMACGGTPHLLGKSKSSEIILAAVRNNAWAHSPMLEVPPFVLYGDGTAIYTRGKQYLTAKLAPQEVRNLWLRLERAGFFEVPSEITLTPNSTDQDVGRIAAHTDQGWRMVRIYNPDVEPDGCPRIDAVRREFLGLNEFVAKNERPWLPRELGVYLSGYANSRGPDIPWPKGLTPPSEAELPPDQSDDPGDVNTHFYRIAPTEQVALANLVEEQATRDRAAVIVHGKKWAVYFVPYVPRVLELFRALDKRSDWPWGFDYGDKPTRPCKEAVLDVKWGTTS